MHGGADTGDVDGWSMARLDVGGARGEWDCGVLLTCDWICGVPQAMMKL